MEPLSYLAFFLFGCLAGWVIDSFFRSINTKHWVNAGYFWGPVCPIYGFGAVLLLILAQLLSGQNVFVRGAVYFVGLSAVEFFGGLFMVHVLKTRLWDYSHAPFNIMGHIDLKHSSFWLFLAFVFEILVWKPMVWLDGNLHRLSVQVSLGIFVFFVAVMVAAVVRKIIVERPKISSKLSAGTPEDARENLLKVEKEYDRLMAGLDRKVVAPAEEPVREWFDEHEYYLEDLNRRITKVEKRMGRVRNRVVTHHMERDLEHMRAEVQKQLADLRARRALLEGGASKRELLKNAREDLEQSFQRFVHHARGDVKHSMLNVKWNIYYRHRGRIFRPRAAAEELPQWFRGWQDRWEELERKLRRK